METQPTKLFQLKFNHYQKIRNANCVAYSSFVIDFEGNVFSFGKNRHYSLGHNDTTSRSTPQKVNNLEEIGSVSCSLEGYYSSFFLGKNYKIWCCGQNNYGQLGNENINSQQLHIMQNIPDIQQISAGGLCFTMMVDQEGYLWAMGYNTTGELGIGNNDDQLIPLRLTTLDKRVKLFDNTRRFHKNARNT